MSTYEKATALGIQGYLEPREAEELAKLAINKKCLEVGSFKGLSSYCIGTTATSLLCVDTFEADGGGQTQLGKLTTFDEFRKAVSRFTNVQWFIGTSEKASQTINETFDFVFIDAMHTYEQVKADISFWWPKINKGGYMAFHDYQSGFPGVVKAVNEKFIKPTYVIHTLAVVKKD